MDLPLDYPDIPADSGRFTDVIKCGSYNRESNTFPSACRRRYISICPANALSYLCQIVSVCGDLFGRLYQIMSNSVLVEEVVLWHGLYDCVLLNNAARS
jgi:hypothetical protein